MAQLEVIDLEGGKSAGDVDRLDKACRENGFFLIKGHGVSSEMIEHVYCKARMFFDLSEDVKSMFSCKGRPNRGYFSVRQEKLDDWSEGDFKEGFDIGIQESGDLTLPEDILMNLPNQYPNEHVLEFEQTMKEFQCEMLRLSRILLDLFSKSLNVPLEHLLSITQHPTALQRILQYPRQNATTIATAPHTDYGLFTILHTKNEGLEIFSRENKWIPVPVNQNCFVVNLGDAMEVVTGGRYTSTKHRVVLRETIEKRMSLPFFFNPSYDAEIVDLFGGEKCMNWANHMKKRYFSSFTST